MKIRAGFVSNSSSSSFVIRKDMLTDEQRQYVLSYKNPECYYSISDLDFVIYGSGDWYGDEQMMKDFLEAGVPEEAFQWIPL